MVEQSAEKLIHWPIVCLIKLERFLGQSREEEQEECEELTVFLVAAALAGLLLLLLAG